MMVKGPPELLKLQILKELPLWSGIEGALRWTVIFDLILSAFITFHIRYYI